MKLDLDQNSEDPPPLPHPLPKDLPVLKDSEDDECDDDGDGDIKDVHTKECNKEEKDETASAW